MRIGKFKSIFLFVFLVVASLSIIACNNGQNQQDTADEEQKGQEEKKELTILYTNDVHAQVMPIKATWEDGEPMMGGFANFISYINKVKSDEKNVIYLDAGDMLTGPSISTLTEGKAIIDLFNHLNVTASVYGNHEFDHGSQNAKDLQEQAKFPILAANIFYKDSGKLLVIPIKSLG